MIIRRGKRLDWAIRIGTDTKHGIPTHPAFVAIHIHPRGIEFVLIVKTQPQHCFEFIGSKVSPMELESVLPAALGSEIHIDPISAFSTQHRPSK
jgi:hypothetical protein